MHARSIRRNAARGWWRYVLAAVVLISLQLCALFAVQAHADINVAYVTVEASSNYASQRTYAGRVMAARTARLGFKRGGELAQVLVDIGSAVSAGQVLAHLDSTTLQANVSQAQADVAFAQANLAAVEAETQLAKNTEQRFRKLLQQGHTPKQTYDEAHLSLRAKLAQLGVARSSLHRARAALQARQAELREATVTAPFAGIIQARYSDEGSQVNAGEAVLRLVEEQNREAHVGIPTHLARQLQTGAAYQVRWQHKTHPASLSAVLPEVDPQTRTLTAVLALADSSIPFGSVVELNLEEAVAEPGFWLPISALTASDRGLWGVYVIMPDNTIERRLVDIVHTEAERVFARGTLTDQDRVVHSGVQRVVPGQQVTPVAFQG